MICPHNDQVICDSKHDWRRDCRRCGWNPEEHARRVAKLSTMGTVFGPNNLGQHVPSEEQRSIKKILKGVLYGW